MFFLSEYIRKQPRSEHRGFFCVKFYTIPYFRIFINKKRNECKVYYRQR